MIYPPLRRAIMAGTLSAFAFAFCAATAHAQFVSITGPQVDVNAVDSPEANASLLESMNQPFAFTFNAGQQFTNGSVSSAVYRRANGFLDFVYQVNVTSATGGVTGINITDFSSATTDGGFQKIIDIDGAGPFTTGGKEPFRAGRPSEGGIQFTFNSSGEGSIDSAEKSTVLVIRTNATGYELGTGAVSAQASGNVFVFAPTSIVAAAPEPGTLALVAMGLLGTAGMVIRRRKAE